MKYKKIFIILFLGLFLFCIKSYAETGPPEQEPPRYFNPNPSTLKTNIIKYNLIIRNKNADLIAIMRDIKIEEFVLPKNSVINVDDEWKKYIIFKDKSKTIFIPYEIFNELILIIEEK